MFLALKNALGRTAVFFRGLLDEYGGSAAAYSLRRLGSAYSGPIVKVRRDSDQAELDFTSVSGVEDWVNGKQETTLPADIATSAAAYGLRKLRSAYTGDAVHIRRSSDDVEVNVQFDSNDKVSASSLIEQAELGLNRAGVILFDGVDDDIDVNTALLPTTDFTLTINAYVTAYPSSDATILGQGTASGTGRTVLQIQNDGQLFVFLNGVGSFTTSNTFNLNEINTIVFSRSGDDYSLTLNGGTASTQTSSGSPQQVNSQIGDGYSGANFKGSIQSLTVGAVSWNGKQSQAESLGWTVNGSPQLSVIVPTTLGDFLTEDTTFIAYDFSSSTDGFVFPANVTLTAGQSIGGESDALKLSVVETVVATVHRTYDIISPIGTGTNFQITFKAYRPSSNVDSGKLGISFAGGILSGNVGPQFFTADDTWEDFTFEQSSGNTNRFYLQLSATDGVGGTKSIFNGTTGDHLFIKDLKIEAVEHSASVVTWYDQSGNDNHATQTVAGDQPKIAEAGALLADGIDFDGVGNYLETTNGYIVELSQNPASVFAVATPGPSNTGKYLLTEGDSLTPYSSQFILNGSAAEAGLWVNTTLIGNPMTPSVQSLTGFIYNETTFQPYLNGAVNGTATAATVNTETSLESYIGSSANADTGFYTGRIAELITYKSDQTNNRFKIESNINNYHDIYTAAEDGYVETWYDQSGNSNNAVHPVLSLQPQIVDSGALMTDENGSPTIQFFHTNTNRNYLEFDPFFATGDDISAFVVTERELNSDWNIILGYDNNNQGLSGTFGMSDNGATRQPRASAGSASINNSVINDDIVNLRTVLWDNSSLSLSSYIDGGDLVTATGTQNVIAPPDKNRIGDTFTVGVSGTVKITEIVLYNSDQSANRTDIESNIAEAYGITLP